MRGKAADFEAVTIIFRGVYRKKNSKERKRRAE
jgi:hypothetical protein